MGDLIAYEMVGASGQEGYFIPWVGVAFYWFLVGMKAYSGAVERLRGVECV